MENLPINSSRSHRSKSKDKKQLMSSFPGGTSSQSIVIPDHSKRKLGNNSSSNLKMSAVFNRNKGRLTDGEPDEEAHLL